MCNAVYSSCVHKVCQDFFFELSFSTVGCNVVVVWYTRDNSEGSWWSNRLAHSPNGERGLSLVGWSVHYGRHQQFPQVLVGYQPQKVPTRLWVRHRNVSTRTIGNWTIISNLKGLEEKPMEILLDTWIERFQHNCPRQWERTWGRDRWH